MEENHWIWDKKNSVTFTQPNYQHATYPKLGQIPCLHRTLKVNTPLESLSYETLEVREAQPGLVDIIILVPFSLDPPIWRSTA